MRSFAISSCLLALVAVFCSHALAAVTLQDAYSSAVEKTESVPISEARAGQAEERVSQATGAIYPQIALQGSYRKQEPSSNGSSAFTQSDQYTTNLNLLQPIFRGFGEWAERRSRQAAQEAAGLAARWERVALYRAVAEAFFGVLAAEAEKTNLTAQLQLTDKQVGELRSRVKIGRSRLGDRLMAETRAALLRSQLEAQENVILAARELFRARTGLDATAELVPETALKEPRAIATLEVYLSKLAERPDTLAAERTFVGTEESVSVAKAGHWPSVDLFANYYFKRTGVLANSHWDVGGQMTWPLFQGGIANARVREAVQIRKSAELTLRATRREAERDLRTQYAAVQRLGSQFARLEEAMDLAERNYAEQQRDFRNGLVNQIEVLTALGNLEETRRTMQKVGYDRRIAEVRLDAAVGSVPQ